MIKANNKELEEAIKTLKEIQESNRAWLKQTKEENCEKMYLRDIEAIQTVLKELKRLQKENKSLKQSNREKSNKLIEITDLYIKSVPKDKIRKKIEERKTLLDIKCEQKKFWNKEDYVRDVLQELLERE